jgi:hypothetical protein
VGAARQSGRVRGLIVRPRSYVAVLREFAGDFRRGPHASRLSLVQPVLTRRRMGGELFPSPTQNARPVLDMGDGYFAGIMVP